MSDNCLFQVTKSLLRTLKRLNISPERARDVWLNGEQCEVPVSKKPNTNKRARCDNKYILIYVENGSFIKGITLLYKN